MGNTLLNEYLSEWQGRGRARDSFRRSRFKANEGLKGAEVRAAWY